MLKLEISTKEPIIYKCCIPNKVPDIHIRKKFRDSQNLAFISKKQNLVCENQRGLSKRVFLKLLLVSSQNTFYEERRVEVTLLVLTSNMVIEFSMGSIMKLNTSPQHLIRNRAQENLKCCFTNAAFAKQKRSDFYTRIKAHQQKLLGKIFRSSYIVQRINLELVLNPFKCPFEKAMRCG